MLMTTTENLQTTFLQELLNNKTPVFMHLKNGIKLNGYIAAFDEHVIMLSSNDTQMVYKHVISTVIPARPYCHSPHKKA